MSLVAQVQQMNSKNKFRNKTHGNNETTERQRQYCSLENLNHR